MPYLVPKWLCLSAQRWRSLKYECIYLNAFDTIREASDGIYHWMNYYNQERPHSSLNDQTPSKMVQKLAAYMKQDYTLQSLSGCLIPNRDRQLDRFYPLIAVLQG